VTHTMPMDVSVVICTYNGQDRLPEVMDALMLQVVAPEIRWEILVIDNNSTDKTSAVAAAYVPRSPVPLKVVVETEQGLVYARRRGVVDSAGRLISFLDDDTIVNPNWVAAVYEFFRTHERAGLVGGKIVPKLDIEAPPYFDLVKRALAISDLGDETIELTHSRLGHPIMPHSGCRREAVEPCLCRDSFEVTGRRGSSLTSCEDSVLAFDVRWGGWQWWYEPKMQMQHHLPSNRLTEEYLRRLFRGMGDTAALTKTAELGRPLTLGEIIWQLWRLMIRYVYYTLVGLTGRPKARRQFAGMVKGTFRTAMTSYLVKLKRRVILRRP
jgi:glycosyltransferase involved in cell wall biosynthesis